MRVLVKALVVAADGLTPAQARMARAALHWSLDQAAEAVGVSRRTILRLENDQRDIQPAKVAAIRRGYETLGLRFLDEGSDASAVVPPILKAPTPK
ncbi:MAG TPA: helix-turn-helix transcriptional regulator [Allosphingosinicella sp.]|nr:helix-turn-helix transcriptional regulator [Allosphingosinicella sp.]